MKPWAALSAERMKQEDSLSIGSLRTKCLNAITVYETYDNPRLPENSSNAGLFGKGIYRCRQGCDWFLHEEGRKRAKQLRNVVEANDFDAQRLVRALLKKGGRVLRFRILCQLLDWFNISLDEEQEVVAACKESAESSFGCNSPVDAFVSDWAKNNMTLSGIVKNELDFREKKWGDSIQASYMVNLFVLLAQKKYGQQMQRVKFLKFC